MPTIDRLTGLTSAAELSHEMARLITEGKPFSYLVCDIDMFMRVNDNYGRDAGDAVLRMIADNFGKVFQAPNQAYREAGDCFMVLFPGVPKEKAFLLAEKARDLIAEERLDYTAADGSPLTQSISGGVASYPEDGGREEEIYRQADAALLRAKKAGRNQICLAREEKMMPKTSHYTPTQLEKLARVAGEQGVGEAVLLRAALDDLLRKYER